MEVNLDSVDFNELDGRYSSLYSNTVAPKGCFHEAIFSLSDHPCPSIQSVNLKEKSPVMDNRIQRIARNHGIKPMGTLSGEAGISVSWGGDKGTEVSGYAS